MHLEQQLVPFLTRMAFVCLAAADKQSHAVRNAVVQSADVEAHLEPKP